MGPRMKIQISLMGSNSPLAMHMTAVPIDLAGLQPVPVMLKPSRTIAVRDRPRAMPETGPFSFLWPVQRMVTAEQTADQLGHPVAEHLAQTDLVVEVEGEGDRGVDVAAGVLAQGVGQSRDDQTEGESGTDSQRDVSQGALTQTAHRETDGRAAADEDQNRGSDQLGEAALEHDDVGEMLLLL